MSMLCVLQRSKAQTLLVMDTKNPFPTILFTEHEVKITTGEMIKHPEIDKHAGVVSVSDITTQHC